jgi:FkbM family methyltransferase
MLKRFSSLLPPAAQQEFRRWKVWLDLKQGRGFRDYEPEFPVLPQLIRRGDWVLDIGANVGYYTMFLSELVGDTGHVFAFEPISATSEILSFITRFAAHRNVTILNAAASNVPGILSFSIAHNEHGLPDYFTAHASNEGNYRVFATTVDSLAFPQRVSFVKIDAEGAEREVLAGMRAMIERDHPVLLIEGHEALQELLEPLGYRMLPRKQKSPNLLFIPKDLPFKGW